MFTKKLCKGLAVIVSTTVFSMSTIQSAYAGPGTLATAPLFLSTIVEPNVYFTLDDSGSMDWNPMQAASSISPPSAAPSGGLPIIDTRRRAYYTPTFNNLYDPCREYFMVPPFTNGVIPEWDRAWIVRTHLANRNYYNPNITYEPWPGTKADGSPMYLDADPTNALEHPDNPGGESIDLTVPHLYTEPFNCGTDPASPNMGATVTQWIPVYYTWAPTDGDGDGIIEDTDFTLPADIAAHRVTIAAGTTEMQNFANWFQYYRSRMNATKAIIGSTINNTDASRMGMRMFNTGHMEDMETMSDAAKKRDLLDTLYQYVTQRQGTPARTSLLATGNYFDDTGGSAPILDAASGGECQQNFNILMSDGFWNGGSPNVGNRDRDGGSNDTIFDGNAAQSNDGGNYADTDSNTLADVAMYNYERDLRGDLADNVPTQPGIDEADHQHLVTYTIAFGLNGTLDPTVDDPLAVGFPGWPTPVANTNTTVDDMWHAAYNGRGAYLSAQDPEQLKDSLNAAIADIAERTATAAAVSINSAKLTTQSVVYLAQFNTNRWQGNIFAFKIIDLDTGELSPTPEWTAADQLNARNIVTNPRTILTHDGTDGAPFQWTDLSALQKDDLKTNPAGGVDPDAVGLARLEYLRGDRTNEGSGYFFRERLSLLSDLVNSGPVFVGEPALNWPDTAPFPSAPGERYSDFKNGPAKTRAGIVYAGSNGGMLHGFAEADGEEKLAYIPSNLFSTASSAGLHYLTDPNYGHRYYNDLTPTVSDIYADLGSSLKWSTVLISGQRGGGRGIFALDVTVPSGFSEVNADKIALWEFSNADDADMGYTYSRPQIALTNAGTWVAIFGNGYNDTGDGKAKLFIVDIAKTTGGAWILGTDYYKITTNSGGTGVDRNGLATPALADLDGDGDVDRVYAGDLKGQMWAFDLSNSSPGAWDLADASGKPLFTTKGDEPITSKPTLALHPTVSSDGTNAPNVMVYFGSGQYLVDADKASINDNYFYGVWDRGDYDLDDGDLQEQTFIPAYAPERVLTRTAVDYLGSKYGWFFELDVNGERSVTNPVVRGGLVFFNSFVPVSDPCSVGGFGYRFAVDMISGGSPDEVAVDVNGDGVIDDNDKASDGSGNTDTIAAIRQEGFLPEPVFIEDIAYTAETPSKVIELPEPPTGRFGWQELIQ
ncbi:MAG: PilC/PilY family type IV pilus protein [Gammaproteobacteria bacterium]|nr:PilC/PilY family type IV pilus protein [Gammaproteobacteria bacterium]